MANVQSLYDDFALPGLDTSKWVTTYGSVSTGAPGGGLVIGVPPAVSQYQAVESAGVFELWSSYAVARVDAMPSAVAGSNASMYLRRRADNTRYYAWVFDGGTLFAQGRYGGAANTYATVPYSASDCRWWRVRCDAAGNVFWETSRDGQIYVVRGSTTGAVNWVDVEVAFEIGYYGATRPSGTFTIGRFTIAAPIDRGPGYYNETFDSLPLGNVLVGKQFAGLWTADDAGAPTTAQIVAGMSGQALRLAAAAAGQAPTVRDNIVTTADVDVTVDVQAASFLNGAAATDVETPAICWRRTDTGYRYELRIFRDYFTIVAVTPSTTVLIRYAGIGTVTGKTFRWRVVMAGRTIVVYRDSGTADSGRASRLMELARVDDANINGAGHIAFRCYQCTAQFDNLVFAPPVHPPAASPVGVQLRQRRWGAYVADPVTNQTLIDNATVLTALETKLGKRFDYASWYLDGNAAYPTTAVQALTVGGRDTIMAWGPTGWSFADILAGLHDTYLAALKTGIAATPGTVYFRLMPEMNGSWAGWSLMFDPVANGVPASDTCTVLSLAQWRAVWAYIRSKINPPNVRWVFCINETDEPRTNVMEGYYPGDDQVDVLAFDTFNWGIGGIFNWREAVEVLHDAYARLAGLTDAAPVWAGEVGCKEPTLSDGAPVDAAHSKGTWLTGMMTSPAYPRLTAIVWFSVKKERDWRLDSSTTALAAAVAGFANESEAS